MNSKSHPQICSVCRLIKAPNLGTFRKTGYSRWIFTCAICLGKRNHVERGRKFRESPLERRARQELSNIGFYFQQEYKLGPWYFDFYVPKLKLLIEIDSKSYHRFPWQLSKDRAKDKHAESSGLKLIRIKGDTMLESKLRVGVENRAEFMG